jgi:hypothetical protein
MSHCKSRALCYVLFLLLFAILSSLEAYYLRKVASEYLLSALENVLWQAKQGVEQLRIPFYRPLVGGDHGDAARGHHIVVVARVEVGNDGVGDATKNLK